MRVQAAMMALLFSFAACGEEGASPGKTEAGKDNSGKTGPGKPKKAQSLRVTTRTWRALLKEALRAELSIAGISIDFGTSDQHKYTRGGWASGWENTESSKDDVSFARKRPGKSKLRFWVRDSPKEVVLRVRSASADPATLQLSVGKKALGEATSVGAAWTVVRVAIPEGTISQGRSTLSLASKTALDVDWLWMPNQEDAGEFSNLPRSLPIKFSNGSRRALAAPSSRSFSFYLHAPPQAKLVVDIGSNQDVEFQIKAETSSGVQTLLSQKADKDKWQEVVVDLSALAGQAIRLELSTKGSLGKTGWGEPEIVIAKGKEAAPPAKRAKNLVYVVMDTTRADSFASVKPDTEVRTPQYDALAESSTTFANAYNNENWTKPSVTTMWSGLYPGTHGARQATSKVDKDIWFLPQQLEKAGFTTGAFIANAVVSETFGFKKGWTHFQNDSDHSLDGNGSRLYPHAAEWMEKHKDERFFLYVQSVDPHTTYDVPKDYWKPYFKGNYKGPIGSSFSREEQMVVDNGKMKINDTDLSWIRALYKGEVSYQDEFLGGLIAKIEELGLMEDTLIVVTNDHGEEIREHGGMGHGWPLFEEQIRAPLLMRYPGIFTSGANVKHVVEHADLSPTILDSLGVSPMKSAEGLSFLPLLADGVGSRQHPFYTIAWSRKGMRSVRVGDWKLIVGKSSDWMYLFNLKDDPGELANLLKKGKAKTKEALLAGRLCEVYLTEALATPDKAKRMDGAGQKQRYDSREIPIDEKTRKELEALGYL